MGKLTTHILDTAHGKPGAGIEIDLYSIDNDHALVKQMRTNADGRVDAPILEGAGFRTGTWELVFHVGAYFREQGLALAEPMFLDEVVVRFGISDNKQHYHVPLLVSPWSYSTYRGS